MALLRGAHRRGAYAIAVVAVMLLAHQATANTVPINWNVPKKTTFECKKGGTPLNYEISGSINGKDYTPCCNPPPGTVAQLGTQTVECGINDGQGNRAYTSFKVTVADNTAPTISVKDVPIEVEATSPTTEVDYKNNVIASDECGTSTIKCSVVSSTKGSPATTYPKATGLAVGNTTISCTATDDKNNTSPPVTFDIVVKDKVPPTLPKDITDKSLYEIEATSPAGAPLTDINLNAPSTADDAVDGPRQVVCTSDLPDKLVPQIFPIGAQSPTTTVVTCTASDTSGNTATHVITVKVFDRTPPALVSNVANIQLEAGSKNGESVKTPYEPSFKDIVDASPVVTCTPPSLNTIFPFNEITTVSCSAVDKYGNQSPPVTFTVTVKDTKAPDMPNVANPYPIDADDETSGILPYFGDAIDTVWGNINITCEPAVGSRVDNSTASVKCRATDGSGNEAVQDYPIYIRTPPSELTLVVPGDETKNAERGTTGTASFTFSPKAADTLNDPKITVSCVNTITNAVIVPNPNPPADNTAPIYQITLGIGTTTITCTAKNKIGKTATGSFKLTVVDGNAPEISCGTFNVLATTPPKYSFDWVKEIKVDDDVSSQEVLKANLKCSRAPTSPDSLLFDLGTFPITCNTTDAFGNSNSTTCTVIVEDKEPPTCSFTTVQDSYLNSNPAVDQSVTYGYTCSDKVDITVPNVTCDKPLTDKYKLGKNTITCTATDKSGNSVTFTKDFVVIDDYTPTINVPADTIIEATQPEGAFYDYIGNVTSSNWDGTPLTPDCQPPSGSLFGPVDNTTTITCTVKAPNGKTASGSFKVTVKDRCPPQIVEAAPANQVLTAGKDGKAKWTPPVLTAKDCGGVDPNPKVVCNIELGVEQTFQLGPNGATSVTTFTCTPRDKSGNSGSSVSFTVTVQKAPAPAVTCPSSQVVELTNGTSYTFTFQAQSNDTSIPAVCDKTSPLEVTLQTSPVKVTCSAESQSGDKDTCSFTIKVQDTKPPKCNGPADKTFEANAPGGYSIPEQDLKGSAIDAVDGAVELKCDWEGKSNMCKNGQCLFPPGKTVITCTATDSSGNKCTSKTIVTITDRTPPRICATDYCECATSKNGRQVDVKATAFDDVDGNIQVKGTGPQQFKLGKTKVTLTATDRSGNVAKQTITVVINDCKPPVVKPPFMKISVNCGDKDGYNLPYNPCTATDDFTPANKLQARMQYSHRSGFKFPVGITEVTCSTKDDYDNVGKATFTVEVKNTVSHCRQLLDEVYKAKPCGLGELGNKLYDAYRNQMDDREKCSCHKDFSKAMTNPFTRLELQRAKCLTSVTAILSKIRPPCSLRGIA